MSISILVEDTLKQKLKEQMKIKPVSKITVKEITDLAQVSHHTFYNHFRDIDDLVGYLFKTEVINNLSCYCHAATWKEAVGLVLSYTYENRLICLNVFYSMGRVHLESFLHSTFVQVLTGIVADLSKPYGLDEELQQRCALFYSDMITGIFTAWLIRNMKETPEEMLEEIDCMIGGAISFSVSKLARMQPCRK